MALMKQMMMIKQDEDTKVSAQQAGKKAASE
jgi:hypothetical protein